MGKFTKIVQYSIALLLVTGCTSKFEDKDPDSQTSSNGFTVEHNIKANENLDRKMQRLEDNAEQIRKLIKLVKRFNASDRNTYTQIDFLLDANDQLAQAPSRSDDGKYLREGHMNLNMKGIAPDCQQIDTRLETMSQGGAIPTDLDKLGNAIDGLIYSVRTCRSQGQFVPVASVTFTSYDISVDFNNDNIRKVLTDIIAPVIQVNSNCQLSIDTRNVLTHGQCTNLTWTASPTETVVIENLVYDRQSDFPVVLDGKVWGQEKPKAQFSLKIDTNLRPWPKLEKIP